MSIKFELLTPEYIQNNSFDLLSFSYDSPIEMELAEKFSKYVNKNSIKIIPQVEIQTVGGLFILDFLIFSNGKKYAIECDGKEFHEYYADLYRDTMLLSNMFIDEMIRLRGEDIVNIPSSCIFILNNIIPNFMLDRFEEPLFMSIKNERWDLKLDSDPDGINFNDDIIFSEDLGITDDICNISMNCGKRFHIIYRFRDNKKVSSFREAEWIRALRFINQEKILSKEEFVARYPSIKIHQQNVF